MSSQRTQRAQKKLSQSIESQRQVKKQNSIARYEKRQNVVVCARFRPINDLERSKNSVNICKYSDDNKTVQIGLPGGKQNKFHFDQVFMPEVDQKGVYELTGKPLVDSVLNGINCTIFAYGQTGAGKTYSMEGEMGPGRGIIPRMVEQCFDMIMEGDEFVQFTVSVCYIEIYLERIRDLFEPKKDNLRVRESGSRGIYVDGASTIYVGSVDDVIHLMNTGSINRAVSATRMNEQSSRSHSVFQLNIEQTNMEGSKRKAKLMLVDLAGSEKVRKTKSSGMRLEEAKQINQSLSTLGRVIHCLTENHKHVPYRDSKLTRLLTDTLGGNSKSCLIVCATPSSYNYDETISTMRFGVSAKTIKNKPQINEELSIAEYKRLVEGAEKKNKQLAEQNKSLRNQIGALRKQLERAGITPEVRKGPKNMASGKGSKKDSKKGALSSGGESMLSGAGFSDDVVDDLQRRISELEAHNNFLQTEGDKFRDKNSDVTSELAVSKSRITELTEALEEVRDKYEKLSEMETQFRINEQKLQFAEQSNQLEMDSVRMELDKLRADNEYLQKQLQHAEDMRSSRRTISVGSSISSAGTLMSDATLLNVVERDKDKKKQIIQDTKKISQKLHQEEYETATIVVNDKPFGMNLSGTRVTSVWGPAQEVGVQVGWQIIAVENGKVDGTSWFDAFTSTKLPFKVTFQCKQPRTRKLAAILAEAEEGDDDQLKKALFIKMLNDLKKLRQRLQDKKVECEELRRLKSNAEQRAALSDELRRTYQAQLQQMEQAAVLLQQIAQRDRQQFQTTIQDREDEIARLKQYLATMNIQQGHRRRLSNLNHLVVPINKKSKLILSQKQGKKLLKTNREKIILQGGGGKLMRMSTDPTNATQVGSTAPRKPPDRNLTT